jgi:tryptophanyl-tRNA synthetase
MLASQASLTIRDRDRLLGYLEGSGRSILVEPQVLLTETPKMPGIDGQKMSKSYGNTIGLREEPETIEKRVRTMPTDPARVRRSDPGEPTKCPVWDFHKIYSDEETQDWVLQGCRSAGIGCLECKQAMLEPMLAELEPIRKLGQDIEANPERVRAVIADGNEAARDAARDTLEVVREAMHLNYR